MFKIRLYALKLCIHSVNLLRCTFITCAMIHVLISFCLWLSCHFNRKHFSGKKKEAKLQVNECWCQGERLHWPLWKEFWPDGVQHRRKGGDLTADLIDLLCCRSVFSLLAGSDPETPHAHAHACKTHHKNICKHSDKQMWFIPHGQSCQFHAGLNRHANTDRGGKHAGITLSLFYHPSGPKLGSNTAKIQMGQRQHQAEQIFYFLGKLMVGQKFQVLCLEMCLRTTHSEQPRRRDGHWTVEITSIECQKHESERVRLCAR